MKKELLILIMIIGSAMILSAEGKQDDADVQSFGRGQGQTQGMMGGNRFNDAAAREEYLEGLETISLTGALILVNGEMPVIESEGTRFNVMAPWQAVADLELKDGMEVTVEGYEMPGPPLQWDDSEKSIMVTKAVINGEEFEIDHDADGYRMMGGFGGRGNAGGPGSGRKGGNQGGMNGRRS